MKELKLKKEINSTIIYNLVVKIKNTTKGLH